MVAESYDIARETYLAILMDRIFQGPVIVASPKGGVDIEEVAKDTPEHIHKVRLRRFSTYLTAELHSYTSHGLLPSDLVAQSVERRRSDPKVVGSIPTLVRVFLCPCVGPFPSVGLTLTWFIWD